MIDPLYIRNHIRTNHPDCGYTIWIDTDGPKELLRGRVVCTTPEVAGVIVDYVESLAMAAGVVCTTRTIRLSNRTTVTFDLEVS